MPGELRLGGTSIGQFVVSVHSCHVRPMTLLPRRNQVSPLAALGEAKSLDSPSSPVLLPPNISRYLFMASRASNAIPGEVRGSGAPVLQLKHWVQLVPFRTHVVFGASGQGMVPVHCFPLNSTTPPNAPSHSIRVLERGPSLMQLLRQTPCQVFVVQFHL